jgi:hypothetical protein
VAPRKAEPPVELTEAVITRLAARADALGIDRVEFTAALTGYLGAVEDSMRTNAQRKALAQHLEEQRQAWPD